MNKKWNMQNRKGYLKIHVAVNIKTKEILSMEVTDEHVHDNKVLPRLVNSVSNDGFVSDIVLGDGAYDSNGAFRFLSENGIISCIKVRKNSITSAKNNKLRNKEVMMETKDLLKWKTKRKYEHRWTDETVFSTIKRTFGEYVYATRFENMIKEMKTKVSLYNLFRRI
jgi:nickel-dependent lactate racemase